MYIFGGFVDGERDNHTFAYNFSTNRWSKIDLADDDARPCARAGHSALLHCEVADNKETPYMYVFGGKDIENDKLNDLWRLNLVTFKWEKMNPQGEVPMERSGHSASLYKGHMLIFGGLFEITKELNDSHLYDFKANTWIPFFHDCGSSSPRSSSPGATKKKGRGPTTTGGGNESPELNHTQTQNRSQAHNSTAKKPEIKVKAPRSPKDKKAEEVQVDLESPTSVVMKGSFLLKQADAQFEYFFN